MNPEIFWLGRGSVFLLVTAVAGWAALLFADEGSPGRRGLTRYLEYVRGLLRFLRSQHSAWALVALQAFLALALLTSSLVLAFWPLALLAPFAVLFPYIQLKKNVAQRTTRITEQIEPWLTALSNALRASPSLGEALASSIALIPAPMSEEIDVLVKEHELGTPLDRALDNMAGRIESKTLAGTVLALKVARRSGGNLPEMLSSAAASLRELSRLEGVLRTKTAEGRAQAVVIGAIPIPMVGLFYLIDPTFFRPLFESFTGHVLIAVACVIWLLAIALAKKILAVDL